MINILIAEDEELLQKVFRAKFESAGYAVTLVGDGEAALSQMRRARPDILLLDIRMPKKDGFQVLTEMKQDSDLATIPVFILSNLSQDPDIETGLKFGAVDYIVKSDFSIMDVVRKVGEHLRGQNHGNY